MTGSGPGGGGIALQEVIDRPGFLREDPGFVTAPDFRVPGGDGAGARGAPVRGPGPANHDINTRIP